MLRSWRPRWRVGWEEKKGRIEVVGSRLGSRSVVEVMQGYYNRKGGGGRI